jgi:hypothetical protein
MTPARTTTDRFAFALARCVVFDLEVYPGRWCVGFRGPGPDGMLRARVVESLDELSHTPNALAERRRTLVGFNSDVFDVPVIQAILGRLDPHTVAQAIVRGDPLPIPRAELTPFPCDHIDVSARLRRQGRIPGLNAVAANLGRPLIRELPYPPDQTLGDDQWVEVKRRNLIDLGHTWALLERFAPELEALAALSDEQGLDLRSTPTPKVAETVFLNAYRARNYGRNPVTPEVPPEVLYRPVRGVGRPQTPAASAWYDRVCGVPLAMVERGVPKVVVPRATFTVGGVTLTVGAGGVHSKDAPRLHYATRGHALYSVDVVSFYLRTANASHSSEG